MKQVCLYSIFSLLAIGLSWYLRWDFFFFLPLDSSEQNFINLINSVQQIPLMGYWLSRHLHEWKIFAFICLHLTFLTIGWRLLPFFSLTALFTGLSLAYFNIYSLFVLVDDFSLITLACCLEFLLLCHLLVKFPRFFPHFFSRRDVGIGFVIFSCYCFYIFTPQNQQNLWPAPLSLTATMASFALAMANMWDILTKKNASFPEDARISSFHTLASVLIAYLLALLPRLLFHEQSYFSNLWLPWIFFSVLGAVDLLVRKISLSLTGLSVFFSVFIAILVFPFFPFAAYLNLHLFPLASAIFMLWIIIIFFGITRHLLNLRNKKIGFLRLQQEVMLIFFLGLLGTNLVSLATSERKKNYTFQEKTAAAWHYQRVSQLLNTDYSPLIVLARESLAPQLYATTLAPCLLSRGIFTYSASGNMLHSFQGKPLSFADFSLQYPKGNIHLEFSPLLFSISQTTSKQRRQELSKEHSYLEQDITLLTLPAGEISALPRLIIANSPEQLAKRFAEWWNAPAFSQLDLFAKVEKLAKIWPGLSQVFPQSPELFFAKVGSFTDLSQKIPNGEILALSIVEAREIQPSKYQFILNVHPKTVLPDLNQTHIGIIVGSDRLTVTNYKNFSALPSGFPFAVVEALNPSGQALKPTPVMIEIFDFSKRLFRQYDVNLTTR